MYETARDYDGLGRLIQTRSEMDGGLQSVVNTSFDARGQARDQYVPAAETANASFARPSGWDSRPRATTRYDGLGRAVRVTHPDGTYAQTWYGLDWAPADADFAAPRLTAFSIDANSHFVRRVSDAYGNLRAVAELTGLWGSADWGNEYRTRYSYDAAGQLLTVRDASGNLTSLSYDDLGRKTSMSDPDMGSWSYAYDAAGNLTRTDRRQEPDHLLLLRWDQPVEGQDLSQRHGLPVDRSRQLCGQLHLRCDGRRQPRQGAAHGHERRQRRRCERQQRQLGLRCPRAGGERDAQPGGGAAS